MDKKPQGFATMSPERRREIAALGGKHAHKLQKAHRFTTETGREAGKKGIRVRFPHIDQAQTV